MTSTTSELQDTREAGATLRIDRPYQPRPIRFLRLEQVGDWRLKLYTIATSGRTPRAELIEAVMDLAPRVFPQPAVSDDRYGTGVVIVHDSATMSIGLFYWWQSVNELHQRVYTGPLDAPRALTKLPDPAAGCVWELSVLDFERRAWIHDVLANPNGPDIERYLTRQFNADV